MQKTTSIYKCFVNPSSLCHHKDTVIVDVPREKRLKLKQKSKKCIRVGYSENVMGYGVCDPSNNTVSTSRNVIVFEEV